MEIIRDCIVFSNDIERILNGNNALDFNYMNNGIKIPDKSFIEGLRLDFKKDVNKIFNDKVLILSEEEMLESINESILDVYGYLPIISLDKIYLSIDNKNIIFLDSTRLDGTKELVSRNNMNEPNDVDNQIKFISNSLIEKGINKIILADDVVFSGSVLKKVIEKFYNNNIDVVGIRSCISSIEPYYYFNTTLPLGLKCGYVMENNVIDQICERDFYFGIAQSGISIKKNDGLVYKAPYFKPYGNPVERASIPLENEMYFSESCVNRSIYLWEEIERLSSKKFYMKDLPEIINLTKKNESVIKVLKKGIDK